MGRPKKNIPEYGTITKRGKTLYRTRVYDLDRKRISLYASTPEELYKKVQVFEAEKERVTFTKNNPTVDQYCQLWLEKKAPFVSAATLRGYESKIRNYIYAVGKTRYLRDITADDVELAIGQAAMLSQSVYQDTHMLFKTIFKSAVLSHIIDESPCENLNPRGGKKPQKVEPLTDDQFNRLLAAVHGLPPYVYVMLGFYAGLRREEILGLQWDCVFLDCPKPYLKVERAWRTEHNRPIVSDKLKTEAARRTIPIPTKLAECLREEKARSQSDFVVSNRDGGALSYTQYRRLWDYITRRTLKERKYTRYYKDGTKEKKVVVPVLGEQASNNPEVVYCLDFSVKSHQLRHTYVTNLIVRGLDPKTVQYLAGHENSKITMDIYAAVKYNTVDQLADRVNDAFEKMGF